MEEATASTRSLEQIPTFLHVHVVRGRISEAEFAIFFVATEGYRSSQGQQKQLGTT